MGAGGSELGVIDDERLGVGVGDRELLVAELERTDLGVVEQACAAALGSGVVPGPQLAEAFTPNRQLADQLVEARIVDVRADEGAREAGRWSADSCGIAPEWQLYSCEHWLHE